MADGSGQLRNARGSDDSHLDFRVYSAIFDQRSIELYSQYRSRLIVGYYALSTTQILLSAGSAVLQTPLLFTDSISAELPLITLVALLLSSIIGTLIQMLRLHSAAEQCGLAQGDLVFYLASQRPMPKHVFDRITQTNTLWYARPYTLPSIQDSKAETEASA